MKLNNKILKINQDDFKLLYNYSERDETSLGVQVDDIIFLPWEVVKIELPSAIEKNDFEKAIMLFTGMKRKMVSNIPLKKSLPFIFFIIDEIKKIAKLEKYYLSSEPDIKMRRAGIDKLNELGDINTIDYLAKGNIINWEKVQKLKYSTVFNKLRKDKIEKDIMKRLREKR